MESEVDHFKVYSERQIDGGFYLWNPHMDLLGFIPSDTSNLSVSVYRLIDDKQSGSPLLFNEKVPFTPTAIGWVPDKRGLTVGDVNGNVFVFDAERQRTIELQKVHDCPIRSLDWVDIGKGSESVLRSCASAKLPKIFATPTSIQQLFGDGGIGLQPDSGIDDSPQLVNESLASSDNQTFMSVLGSRGNVQIYYGGSIPAGEFCIHNLFQNTTEEGVQFSNALLSPDLSTMSIVGDDPTSRNIVLFLVNTGLLRFRKSELSRLCRTESDIDWLLRQFNQSVSAIDRAVSGSLDDFDSSLGSVIGEIDEEMIECMRSPEGALPAFIKDFVARDFSAPGKLGKLSRSTLNTYDFLVSMLISRARVITNHLLLRASDLMEMDASSKYSVLGLSKERVQGFLNRVGSLRSKLDALIDQSQETVYVLKHVFSWLEGGLESKSSEEGTKRTSVPSRAIELLKARPDIGSSTKTVSTHLNNLLMEGKEIELLYLSLLSNQRRTIASRIVPKRVVSFPRVSEGQSAPFRQARWTGGLVELVWEDNKGGTLVVCQIDAESGDIKTRLEFQSPERSVWKLSRQYKEGEVCSILVHEGQSTSVCLLDYSHWVGLRKQIGPDEYGFPMFFIAQQLPNSVPVALEVSGSRGLCSIYVEGGRMITLDLENADDENEDELSNESSSSPEVAVQKRRNLRKLDSLLDNGENKFGSNTPSSNESMKSSPSATPVVQRLRFAP